MLGEWFSALSIQTNFAPDGVPITILSGEVANQSALSGILVQPSELSLTLISVNPVGGDQQLVTRFWS